jgi:hypothetical protein
MFFTKFYFNSALFGALLSIGILKERPQKYLIGKYAGRRSGHRFQILRSRMLVKRPTIKGFVYQVNTYFS